METIDINITKAKIKSFNVTLDEDKPTVTASVDLFTPNDVKVTSFSLSTESYYDRKFDLPASMVGPILNMARELEHILVLQANKELCLLPTE